MASPSHKNSKDKPENSDISEIWPSPTVCFLLGLNIVYVKVKTCSFVTVSCPVPRGGHKMVVQFSHGTASCEFTWKETLHRHCQQIYVALPLPVNSSFNHFRLWSHNNFLSSPFLTTLFHLFAVHCRVTKPGSTTENLAEEVVAIDPTEMRKLMGWNWVIIPTTNI